MAYGRLDVFWPDGKYETFSMEAASVSVGRSSGNTIMLDTDTISRYHFSITHQDDQVQLTDLDSANGTYIDGQQMQSNQPRILQGGEEIQIGHLRMIYHAVDDMPTLPMSALAEDTQRIERETVGFRIDVYGPEFAVPPGSHTFAEVSITNTTDVPNRYTVKVSGLPEDWIRINRPELDINPQDTASIVINIKPFRHSDSVPGSYPVKVVVALKNEPETRLEAEITARILPFGGFGMALSANKIASGEPFRLHVHNQGSAGLPLFITGRNKDDQLNFGIPTPQLILAPGQRQVVQGEIRTKKTRLFGAPHEYEFDLLVRSRDDAAFLAAIPGHFVEKPVLPGWAALSLIALSFGVVALVILGVILVLQAASPDLAIRSFQAEQSRVVQGDVLGLSWDVTGADQITISVNGQIVRADISPEISTTELETSAYNGDITVSLMATSNNETISDSLAINVFAPITVDYFEVIPPILVRNVVQEITVRWKVTGASFTNITGLEAFTTTLLAATYGAEETLSGIAGVPSDRFAATLYAEDAQGRNMEQILTIEVIDPTCVPTNTEIILHVQPDSASNVVSTVPGGTTLVVDRRDISGAWIRAVLAGGVTGWGARADLSCANNFNMDALLAEITTTPPTPTESSPVTPVTPQATLRQPTLPVRPTSTPRPVPTVRP